MHAVGDAPQLKAKALKFKMGVRHGAGPTAPLSSLAQADKPFAHLVAHIRKQLHYEPADSLVPCLQ